MERSGSDLVLHLGNGESMGFYAWFDTAWQDNKSISTLQVIAEAMQELLARGFDLDGTAGDERMRWRIHAAITNIGKAANDPMLLAA